MWHFFGSQNVGNVIFKSILWPILAEKLSFQKIVSNALEKTTSLKKKIHEKNRFEKKVMTIFLKIFFRKKSKIFKKKIFQKCYFIFKHGEKKKFFFEKFSGPDFDPNFENVTFCWPLEFWEKFFRNFFSFI